MTETPTRVDAAELSYVASLVECPHRSGGYSANRVWFITHPLGRPAGGTFTRVEFAPAVDQPEHVLDAVVRRIAVDLYGTAWAFHYRPDQAQDAIHRHGMRVREAVTVHTVEVYS